MENIPEALKSVVDETICAFDNYLMVDDEAREWFENNKEKLVVFKFSINSTKVSIEN